MEIVGYSGQNSYNGASAFWSIPDGQSCQHPGFGRLDRIQNNPGTIVDQSQRAPVVLTKNKRRYAAVVSIDYLERAEAALAAVHANRRVITSETMTHADAARLEASLPNDAEITSSLYNWQRQN